MKKPQIFISMGTPYTEAAKSFRDELESFLRNQCNVNPTIIGKNTFPSGNPLNKIKEVMLESQGVIVVAYERKYVNRGIEKRGGREEKLIGDSMLTTSWNHIESAMAFTMGLPLYIICQNGLTEEGLIETKTDWIVQHLDLNENVFKEFQVTESIKTWVDERVRTFPRKKALVNSMQGRQKFSDMTPKEVIGVIAVFGAIFALGIAAARFFPTTFN